MITNRFAKFAAAAIGVGALAGAATASAQTYQGLVIGGPSSGHTIVPARCLNGSTQWHRGESQRDVAYLPGSAIIH